MATGNKAIPQTMVDELIKDLPDMIADGGRFMLANKILVSVLNDDPEFGAVVLVWNEGNPGQRPYASTKLPVKNLDAFVQKFADAVRRGSQTRKRRPVDSSPMTVFVIEVGKPGREEQISGGLESMQKIVGGYIEIVRRLGNGLLLIGNEDGLAMNLPKNIFGLVGTVFFVRDCPSGFASLTAKDVEALKREYGGEK